MAASSLQDPAANPFVAAMAEEAREVGLRYVSDQRPGIGRERVGQNFRYRAADGQVVSEQATLARIKHLAIPPAWEQVWICPYDNGHIQSVGRDAKNRKQYRYHAEWRRQREAAKYDKMLAFGRALPQIRKKVQDDLALPSIPRDKVLATVVALLEASLIRIGNDEYARENHSFGLTTMRRRHARITKDKIEFSFKGKSGKRHEISVRDRQLARIVKRCQDLPGQELFVYEDADGATHRIDSDDVNDYLRAITQQDFTAKDFRTWTGTVLAAIALREFTAFTSQKEAKKNVITAIEAVSKMLGNTPSVCRKCYVHPHVLDGYLAGSTIKTVVDTVGKTMDQSLSELKPEEAAVMVMLEEGLKTAALSHVNGHKRPSKGHEKGAAPNPGRKTRHGLKGGPYRSK